jgi:diguanylate cyclase (GGDEF)-like protein/PAS domain S-box-containing protein
VPNSAPRIPFTLLAAGIVLYAIANLIGDAGDGWREWLAPTLYAAAGALMLAGAIRRTGDRAAFALLAIATLVYAVGSVAFALDGRISETYIPPLAHAGWLIFYVFAYGAVFLLLRARMRTLATTLALDGLAGALTLAAVVAVFVLDRVSGSNGIADSDTVVGLTYAGADILLLSMVVWAAWLTGRTRSPMWRALALGAGLLTAGDLVLDVQAVVSGLEAATIYRVFYPLAFAVLAIAAWHAPATSKRPRIDSLAVLAIPAVCVAIALVILAVDRASPVPAFAYWLAMATLTVAFARAALTYRELRRLKEGQRFLRGFEDAAIGMALSTPDGRWLRVNEAFCRTLGRTPDELVDRPVYEVVHPDEHADHAATRTRFQREQTPEFERRMLHSDGSVVEMLCSTVFVDSDGDVPYVSTQFQDVTARNRAERQNLTLAELGRLAIDSPDSGTLLSRAMPLVATSLDAHVAMVVTADQPVAPLALSVPLRRRDQVLVVERDTPATASDERFLQAVADVLTGALDRADQDSETRRRALHDPLTGLANRTYLTQRVEAELHTGDDLALLLLDVDRFKLVNDTLGHTAGDELLREVARRLDAVTRHADMVVRLGGDEFVVASVGLGGVDGAVALAERIVDAFAHPFAVAGRDLVLGTSVGVALADEHADSAEALLRNADVAMYRAKESGGGRHVVFDAALRAKVVERMTLEVALRGATARGELRLHYQPLIALQGEHLHGFEALVRWQHPELGLVPPDAFIPIAEDTGLIREIGAWVLDEACRQLAVWKRGRSVPLKMGVNLSAVQLEPELVDHVAATIARHGLDPADIVVEITESLLVEGAALEVIGALRDLGVAIVLDDFGTGYSSLGYISEHALDGVKLDRSLIADIGHSVRAQGLVRGIIEMAEALGLTVCAEGLEDEQQVVAARAAGCTLGQGWHYAKALPAAEAEALIAPTPVG